MLTVLCIGLIVRKRTVVVATVGGGSCRTPLTLREGLSSMPSAAVRALERDPAEAVAVLKDDAFVPVYAVAARLRVHSSTVYRWLNAGTFPSRAFKVGASWRIDATDFEHWFTHR